MQNQTTPYYAVIFTSVRTKDTDGYEEMAEKMVNLAQQQPGFLGMDSVYDNIGITISYWESMEAIKRWKQHTEHLVAQQKGKTQWYAWYKVRICKVVREYGAGNPVSAINTAGEEHIG
ncbi:MAG: antibiotic biosynthesis monooxygenase [Bacteroidota bacterium]